MALIGLLLLIAGLYCIVYAITNRKQKETVLIEQPVVYTASFQDCQVLFEEVFADINKPELTGVSYRLTLKDDTIWLKEYVDSTCLFGWVIANKVTPKGAVKGRLIKLRTHFTIEALGAAVIRARKNIADPTPYLKEQLERFKD